jgi:hypothetical protein
MRPDPQQLVEGEDEDVQHPELTSGELSTIKMHDILIKTRIALETL